MTDLRFHRRQGPFTLAELAEIGALELPHPAAGETKIQDIAPLDQAGEQHLSFLDNTAYLSQFAETGAAACIVHPKFADRSPNGVALLIGDQPYRSFALIAQAFYPRRSADAGIARSAVVDQSASIAEDCEISPNVVIGPGVKIGAGCYLGPGSVVAENVEIGREAIIGAQVTLSHCLIGDRVTLHPGVRIGQDGFGFAPDSKGHEKVPQIGRVIIADDCDIGANTTIDRGSLQDTIIKEGCWIDNLVQIGHNVEIGRGSIIVAQTGIAGSTKIGEFVAIGGHVAIAGHLEIGAGAQLAAKSGVMANVSPGATLCGSPAVPIREFFRQVATLKKLASPKDKKDG